ncbi:MAG TPA: nuclear transport factor 2 family protein [Acidobacteriota bacterium]|jgi:hypothetical protein
MIPVRKNKGTAVFHFAFALSIFFHAFAPWGVSQNNDRTANELRRIENGRMESMTRADIAALEKLLGDDLTYVHSSGRLETKAEFLQSLRSGKLRYKSIDIKELQVRPYGNTAVLTGRCQVEINSNGEDLSFEIRYTDIWVKRQSTWQMVAWQATRLPG